MLFQVWEQIDVYTYFVVFTHGELGAGGGGRGLGKMGRCYGGVTVERAWDARHEQRRRGGNSAERVGSNECSVQEAVSSLRGFKGYCWVKTHISRERSGGRGVGGSDVVFKLHAAEHRKAT